MKLEKLYLLPLAFDAPSKMLKQTPQTKETFCGAEIGVAKGELAEALLRYYPALHLTLVDRWEPAKESETYYMSGDGYATDTAETHERNYNLAFWNTQFARDRRLMVREDMIKGTAFVPDGSLDFIFLDADHTTEGTLQALNAWVPKVKQGGVISGHDWDRYGVNEAVETYRKEMGYGSPLVTGDQHSWGFLNCSV